MEPSKDEIVDLMMGFFKAKAITAALELRLFDTLRERPATIREICACADIPEQSGKRLLIALHAMGLLTREGEAYALTETASKYLVSDSSEWLGWLARHIDIFLYPLWANLAAAVRSGLDQREAVFGDNRSWFDILYNDPRDVVDFQRFLGILAKPFVEGFVQGFDITPYKRFLDIGSGIGNLPMAVADANQHLDIDICELPKAANFVREQLAQRGYSDRIGVIEGDVILGTLREHNYDLVHLGWMLHDFAPELQIKILKNVLKAMPSGGVFVASETPLDDDEAGPSFVSLLSINMLVSTDGGIESTRSQYIERFKDAGFVDVRVVDISGSRTLFVGQKP
ncbi:methyltransferase [Vreelandella titanicae]|uniref:methyltransferase n=1 Tax=Vreelandella titanicae TaxID=664683 RepID=UPI00241DCD1B|nr:methyltransferase [Halomonas titanicae]UEQ05304.1 acetylserotonin O-methyltransferase [Halomonas profundus]